MSAEPTTAAPTGNDAPANQTLNEREVRTLANGFRALEASTVIEMLKLVNFERMAEHMGITNKDSARNSLKKILEKLTQAEENGEVIKTAANKPAATAATPRKRAAAGSRTKKAATDGEPAAADAGAGADNYEDEDVLPESPSKRPRKAATKTISATKTEDGEAANGEGGVSRDDVLAAAESAAGGAGANATKPRASRKNGTKADVEGDAESASAPKNEAGNEDANDGDEAPAVNDPRHKKPRAPRKTKADKDAEAAAAAAAAAAATAADDGEAAPEDKGGADPAGKPRKPRASRKKKTTEADSGAAEGEVGGKGAKSARKKPAPRGKKAAGAKDMEKSDNEGEGAEDEANEGKKATTRGGKKAAAAAKDEEEKKASEMKASKKSATPAASAAEEDGGEDGGEDGAVDGKDAAEHANGTKDKDSELSDAPDNAETAEDEASGDSME